jgi:hypothetical protein
VSHGLGFTYRRAIRIQTHRAASELAIKPDRKGQADERFSPT